MKKNVILPFEDHPYSQMYHHIAFPMGIIQGNAQEDITPWLCGRYINCLFDKNKLRGNAFNVYTSDLWANEDNVLIQQRITLIPDLYDAVFGNPILHLRNMIGMGYYPSGLYNEEYIPGKWAYQKQYNQHDFLLIGYDDDSEEFISVSYLQDGKFQRHAIPYGNMRKALTTLKTEKLQLLFLKFNAEAKFELNLNRTVSELSDYLRSTTSTKKLSDDVIWGMDAIRRLIGFFLDSTERDSSVDIRFTRGLMEHKFYMYLRMDCLLKRSVLTDPLYVEKAQEIYKIAERVHMLGLKYNFTGNKTIASNIQNSMNEMFLTESKYLPSVLSDLQTYKGEMT